MILHDFPASSDVRQQCILTQNVECRLAPRLCRNMNGHWTTTGTAFPVQAQKRGPNPARWNARIPMTEPAPPNSKGTGTYKSPSPRTHMFNLSPNCSRYVHSMDREQHVLNIKRGPQQKEVEISSSALPRYFYGPRSTERRLSTEGPHYTQIPARSADPEPHNADTIHSSSYDDNIPDLPVQHYHPSRNTNKDRPQLSVSQPRRSTETQHRGQKRRYQDPDLGTQLGLSAP